MEIIPSWHQPQLGIFTAAPASSSAHGGDTAGCPGKRCGDPRSCPCKPQVGGGLVGWPRLVPPGSVEGGRSAVDGIEAGTQGDSPIFCILLINWTVCGSLRGGSVWTELQRYSRTAPEHWGGRQLLRGREVGPLQGYCLVPVGKAATPSFWQVLGTHPREWQWM